MTNEKYTKWTKQILGTRLISVEAQNAALLKALEIQNAALREALDDCSKTCHVAVPHEGDLAHCTNPLCTKARAAITQAKGGTA